jgi:hypothetical protein
VSSPSNRRISAYVRVVVLGVLRRTTVYWAGKAALTWRPRPPGIRQAPYDPGERCTLPRQRTLVGCTLECVHSVQCTVYSVQCTGSSEREA